MEGAFPARTPVPAAAEHERRYARTTRRLPRRRPQRRRDRPDRTGAAGFHRSATTVAGRHAGARPRRAFPGRDLAPPPPELPDPRAARQLPPPGPSRRAAGLRFVPPADGGLRLLPGQPGRPAVAAQGAGAQGPRTPAALLRIERRLSARLHAEEVVTR